MNEHARGGASTPARPRPSTAPRTHRPTISQATPGPAALVPEPLSGSTLGWHAQRVHVPTYDRSALTPAVVHFSVGGFHRAHQLVYFDDLAERGETGWGVIGVGLRSPAMRDALQPQDHLYTVVERSRHGERARVVGSMVDYLFAPDAPDAVLAALTDDRTRLVTMTVTGTAYRIDPRTGEFDPDDDDVRADLDDPHHPRSLFGYIVEGLDRRRRAGQRPFTVLSCDNMQSNGEAARAAVVGFARLRDEVLARWIADSVAFPGSMVDRITPSTSPEDRDEVARRFGVADRWPVITEPFSQWVMQDEFCHGRPPLEDVGVQFVPDVSAYELMKTRLLNASHSALGHLGSLAGHVRMDEVMADPDLSEYVSRLMSEEIAPLLPVPAGIDLDRYQRTLLDRFADPAIADRLARLCRRGSSKVPLYVLPSLHAALAAGRRTDLLTLAVAGFCRYLRGTDMQGHPFPLEDDRAEELRALAVAGGTDPRPLLAVRAVFGDLGDRPDFVEELAGILQQLDREGVRATLAARLDAAAHVRHHPVNAPADRRGPGASGRRPADRDTAGPVAPVPGNALLPA